MRRLARGPGWGGVHRNVGFKRFDVYTTSGAFLKEKCGLHRRFSSVGGAEVKPSLGSLWGSLGGLGGLGGLSGLGWHGLAHLAQTSLPWPNADEACMA